MQLVLENLWAVYEARDKEKIKVMAEKLGVQMSARDARHPDPKVQVKALLAQWMPLASSVLGTSLFINLQKEVNSIALDMIACKIPSPDELSSERALGLMSSQHYKFDSLPPQSQALKQSFLACDSSDEAPIIVFISKMIPVRVFLAQYINYQSDLLQVDKTTLPQNRPKPLNAEEIARRKQAARERHTQMMAQAEAGLHSTTLDGII